MGIISLLIFEADPGIQADAATSLNELFHGKDFFPGQNEQEQRVLTPAQVKHKEACLAMLYERYMVWIVKPFQDSAKCPVSNPGRSGSLVWYCFFLLFSLSLPAGFSDVVVADAPPDIRIPRAGANNAMILLSDFLSNCVLNHGYRAKYFILQNRLIDTVVQLCERKEKILRIGLFRH